VAEGIEAPGSERAAIEARLLQAGAEQAEIDGCRSIEDLVKLAIALPLRPEGPVTSLRVVADAAGITAERAAQLCTVAGLRVDDVDAEAWFGSDAVWLADVEAAAVIFGESATLALVRRAGAATSQLARASGAAFRVSVLGPDLTDASPALGHVERNLGSRDLAAIYIRAFSQLFRHHLLRTVRTDTVAAGSYGELRPMAVGFVDLASSTELGERISAAELANLIVEFDEMAFEAATRAGARVVKTIGDEVMLAADEPGPVTETALALVERCRQHATFASARGAVALGPVLEQDGDCYGPVVNRAARLVAAAADGSVVADRNVLDHLSTLVPAWRTTALAPVELRGIGEVEWGTVDR